jgi:hypothetical protein
VPISKRCSWCHGDGRIIKPCPVCGGLQVRRYEAGQFVGVDVVYEAGSIWDEAPARPKLRDPRRRAQR